MSPATFLGRRGMTPVETRHGWIDGYRVCFDIPVGPGERGVANLAVVDAFRTHGVAHLLSHADAEHLDRTEGVHAGLYRREPVRIGCDVGPLDGFTYRSTVTTTGRKPSARYLNILLDGARTHGLPGDYLAFLESFELAIDERLQAGD
jgi:hypothetical protein